MTPDNPGYQQRPMYYDREGRPIGDVLDWAARAEDLNNKRVAESTIGDLWVSTVWLGLDHNFSGHGRPLIFETMVFHLGTDADIDDPQDEYTRRYATETEAQAGHDRIVAELQELAADDGRPGS